MFVEHLYFLNNHILSCCSNDIVSYYNVNYIFLFRSAMKVETDYVLPSKMKTNNKQYSYNLQTMCGHILYKNNRLKSRKNTAILFP